jgi:integrase/recombinase XerD
MTALGQNVDDYLAVRRGLGFKLTREQRMLNRFVAFMDDAGASTVTVDLSVRWATMPTGVGHAYLAQRMRAVRGFAPTCTASTRRPRFRRLSCCPHASTARPSISTPRPRSRR